MAFTDLGFALFAGVLLLLYYKIPCRFQWLLLLMASLAFYLSAGVGFLFFLLFPTLTAFFAARQMAGIAEKGKRRPILVLTLIANFGILAICKARFSFQGIALPLGISFYLFQTMGFLLDVYRGTAKPGRNFLKFSLFVSWFPLMIQGPICKYQNLLPQLLAPHRYDSRQVAFGCQRMLWGYFKKLVIADRMTPAVLALKGETGPGFFLLSLLYAIQIYADFTGGIDIAIGLSQAFGITLPENFKHPFFSKSIAEFWRRWHITLGEWMKAYIFFPVSVSRPMLRLSKFARQKWGNFGRRLPVYIATAVTWFATGIWHGLTPNFVLWGMLNCFFILLSEELAPLYKKFHSSVKICGTKWYGSFQVLRTFVLMNLIRVCDLFPNPGDYFHRLGSLFTDFHWNLTLSQLGLTSLDVIILAGGTGLMFTVSLIREKRGSIRELLWSIPWPVRYVLTFGLFLTILLLGRYGVGYDASSFIYNQF